MSKQELTVDWPKILIEQPRLEGEGIRPWLRRIAGKELEIKYKTSYYRHRNKFRDLEQYKTEAISTDKKEADFHWRTPIKHLKALQEVFADGKDSQDFSHWSIDADSITVVVVGDLHMGSWATDYDLFCEI